MRGWCRGVSVPQKPTIMMGFATPSPLKSAPWGSFKGVLRRKPPFFLYHHKIFDL